MPLKGPFRLRKATDIHRKHATFELLADDVVLLDMGLSDEGTFEIAFNEPIGGYVITWDDLQDLIEKGQTMVEADRDSGPDRIE